MEEFIMTQEAFDRLWQRVQGGETAPKPRSEADTLRRLSDDTAQALALERRLQGQCAALVPLCRETASRLRRLRAAYYLETGECCCPPETCSVRGGLLPALRADCLAARARAGRYAAAAKTYCWNKFKVNKNTQDNNHNRRNKNCNFASPKTTALFF